MASNGSGNNSATLAGQAKSAAAIAGGHASYASGAVQEAIGNATGSSAWTESGEQVKKDAASSIKESFNAAPEGGKLGELSDKACPQTGDGVGDQSKQ